MKKNNNSIFNAKQITKRFSIVTALENVDIEIQSGEIRGLIGENGSGKSTFSSIVAGIQQADHGTMTLKGIPHDPSDALDAKKSGVSMIVQEQGTVKGVSVAANIFLGDEQLFVKYGFLSKNKMYAEAENALKNIGIDWIDPRTNIDKLSFEDKKLVEIARAMYSSPVLLIVDETTTALSAKGRDIIYDLMEKMKKEGNAVLFISHDLDEVVEKCDFLTVLRDGNLRETINKDEFDKDLIRQLMIGRTIEGDFYRSKGIDEISDRVVLEAKDLSTHFLENINLKLHKGEILGIGGLSDCGMHELGKTLFGIYKPNSGIVIKEGKEKVTNPSWSVDKNMAYVSKDRDTESMMLICSIRDNICLPSLKKMAKKGLINPKKEIQLAEKWSEELQVKADSIKVFCNTLSGGNKQKVVLAKWLAKNSEILILDCPTRGIDIGAKASIYSLIENFKNQGKSIILISEELAELIGMSDRIITMKNGKLSASFSRKDGFSESKLIKTMI